MDYQESVHGREEIPRPGEIQALQPRNSNTCDKFITTRNRHLPIRYEIIPRQSAALLTPFALSGSPDS